MAMELSPSGIIKVESNRPFSSTKILVGLLLAMPFGAAVYLWRQTRNLHQRITTLKSEDEDSFLPIGCQLRRRKKRIIQKETIDPLLSEEENLAFLKNAVDDANSRIEDLSYTIRWLEEQVKTVHTESNAIHKRIDKFQKWQEL